MFQSFENTIDPSVGPARLDALRAELSGRGLTGFLVPRTDEYQGEYVAACAERLAWLTGFTGSAGLAVMLAGKAAIFVDGRYTLQVRAQVDVDTFQPQHLTEMPPEKWIAENAGADDRIGYDPWLHTSAQVKTYAEACAKSGAELVRSDDNPLDAVWTDRPAPPLGAITLHGLKYSGEASSDKLARIDAALVEAGADAAVLTETDAIAWTFNIRGGDVPHAPLPHGFALLRAGAMPQLFVDGRKLSNSVRGTLAELAEIAEPGEFLSALAALGDAKVIADPAQVPAAVADAIEAAGGTLIERPNPTIAMKAKKNAVEADGARAAHRRDGVAMAKFLAWLDENAGDGSVDEIAAAKQLESFRAESGDLRDISFDTISGAGANGAVVHYRVTTGTNAQLKPGTLFLVDSGGQYPDGTTDITRTVAIGTPSAEMRDRFTRVLKGHIAIATARFPVGTSGAQLDTLARTALWQAGLDYDHGTGHGVGSYLNVHEGPQRIAKTGTVALEPGMIVSNEPGYYKTGEYGIRIENLVLVTGPEEVEGGERPLLSFETLTLCPIDLRLVEPSLMSAEEIAWLNAYHARVRTTLAPLLDEDMRAWLGRATRPLAAGDLPE